MTEFAYTLRLSIQAPVLSHAVGALALGYDKAMLGDGECSALPGSLIRGNLRHALEHFRDVLREASPEKAGDLAKYINLWFGPRPPEIGNETKQLNQDSVPAMPNQRALLQFDYYWKATETPKTKAKPQARHRIKIDTDTGTVAQGQLLVIETPFASGTPLVFEGNIHTPALSEQEIEDLQFWLDKAANYLPAVGALKGVGFGKVTGADLKPAETRPQPVNIKKQDRRIPLSLEIDRPFCIAQAHKPDSNLFHGEAVIPGGVIKALLANALSKSLPDEAFDKLVVSHARPAKTDQNYRERVVPWSLCMVEHGAKLVDLAWLLAQRALEGKQNDVCLYSGDSELEAPTFQIDWKPKQWNTAETICKLQADPKRHLSVHTAIDAGTGLSNEGQLFSLDCIDPKDHAWLLELETGAVKDETQRIDLLNRLESTFGEPLPRLGKTKANVTVRYAESDDKTAPDRAPAPNIIGIDGKEHALFVVTLQTPARMLTSVSRIPASGGAQDLHNLYENYWGKSSGGKLELVTYVARQTRVGGQYLYDRYWRKKNQTAPYEPWWLTDPGSVFVLEVAAEASIDRTQNLLQHWQRFGLPQPEGGESYPNWEWNPYIRENGYGEIRVNDEIHTTYQAVQEEWEWFE